MLVPASSELVEPGWLGFPGKNNYSTLSFSQHLSMLCAHTTWICLVFAQCCACAQLGFSVLYMRTTVTFSVVHVHN